MLWSAWPVTYNSRMTSFILTKVNSMIEKIFLQMKFEGCHPWDLIVLFELIKFTVNRTLGENVVFYFYVG
jgi:hypothetical protein